VTFGFLNEASLQLRTADSPAERATAARKLGVVGNVKGSKQLIESLEDSAPEVRRACVESLGQIRDAAAIAPLNNLLLRETSRQLPLAVIRHAINSIAVNNSPSSVSETPVAAPVKPPVVEPVEIHHEKPEPGSRRDLIADYLVSLEQRAALITPVAPSLTPAAPPPVPVVPVETPKPAPVVDNFEAAE